MVTQLLLRMSPAKAHNPLTAAEWRQAVGAQLSAADGTEDHAEVVQLFNHVAGGAPGARATHEKPRICFTATTRWVGCIATGDEAIALIQRFAGDILDAARAELGPCGIERIPAQLLYERSERRVWPYLIHNFAGQRNDRGRLTTARVHQALVRSLNAWAATFGLDSDFSAGDVLIHQVIPLPTPAVSVDRARRPWGRDRVRIEFAMPIRLDGWWFAGGLASRGHGLISHDYGRRDGAS
jgi:hypothetical protein